MTRRRTQRRCDNADPGNMAEVFRYDRGATLRAPRIMDDGTMLVEARIAKPGILRYVDARGNVTRELIPASELHDPASLATLGRVAVTLEHPPEDVSPDNVERFGVGDVDGSVSVDPPEAGGYVRVNLAIRRRDAIDAVNAGKAEMSPGYRVLIDPTPGTHSVFGVYDAIQRRRRYNHAAIVDAARGGSDIVLRADAAQQLDDTHNDTPQGGSMNPLLLALLASLGADPTRFATDDAGLAEVKRRTDDLTSRADAGDTAVADLADVTEERDTLKETNTQLTTDLAAMTGERDTFKAKADAADVAEQAKADAAEREQLGKLATRLKVDGIKDDTELAEIRKAVAAKHLDSAGGKLPDDADDGYIRGVLATIPTERADAVDPWASVGRQPDGDDKRRDNDPNQDADKSAAEIYYARADAAFKAARAGGAA